MSGTDLGHLCQVIGIRNDLAGRIAEKSLSRRRCVKDQDPSRAVTSPAERMDRPTWCVDKITGRIDLYRVLDQKPHIALDDVICFVPWVFMRRRPLVLWQLDLHQRETVLCLVRWQ